MRNHDDGRTRPDSCSARRSAVSEDGGYRTAAAAAGGSGVPSSFGNDGDKDAISSAVTRPVSQSPFLSPKRHCGHRRSSSSEPLPDDARIEAAPSSFPAAMSFFSTSPPSSELLPPHATGSVQSLIARYGGGGSSRPPSNRSQCRGDEPYREVYAAVTSDDGTRDNGHAADSRRTGCSRCNGGCTASACSHCSCGAAGSDVDSCISRPIVVGRLRPALPKQTAVTTNGFFGTVDSSTVGDCDMDCACSVGAANSGRPPRSPRSPRSPLLSKVAGLRLNVPCSSGPPQLSNASASAAACAPPASSAATRSSLGAMLPQIGYCSSDSRSGIAAAAAASSGHPYVFSRPIIVLQRSFDSFCSTSPSPVVDCCHGSSGGGSMPQSPPQWPQLQQPLLLPPAAAAAAAAADRSRRSSSGSADSAVCDLSSAAGEAATSSDAASPVGRGSAPADGRRVSGSDLVIAGGLPSVVVEPGSPAAPLIGCLDTEAAATTAGGDAGAYAGDVSIADEGSLRLGSSSRGGRTCYAYEDEDGPSCGLLEPPLLRARSQLDVQLRQQQQQQLLLLPPCASSDALQRKASSESMCSEYSSFTCDESVDEEPTGSTTTAVCDPRTDASAFGIDSTVVTMRHRDRSKHSSAVSSRNRAEVTAAWIQLAGHRGTFLPFRSGTILKKHCAMEEKALLGLMDDPLRQFVPELYGIVDKDGDKYIEIQDLLAGFCEPSVMDCKIGVRTYLEDELEKALKNPQPRQDMYDKMVKVDPDEPTPEEHSQRGVTKPRYMQWRERVSSSEKLGFRIEAVRRSDGTAVTDFKKTRDRESIVRELLKFTGGRCDTLSTYLERLIVMRRVMEESNFLTQHEVIGSSLLFVHDDLRADVWMIDFGKTLPLSSGTSVTHRAPWLLGNHEDGYLTGIDNVISVLTETVQQAAAASSSCSSPSDAVDTS